MLAGFEFIVFICVVGGIYAVMARGGMGLVDRRAALVAVAVAGAIAIFLYGVRNSPFMVAVYFIIWWTVLFAILPFGVRSQVESGVVVEGSEPGAPVAPALIRKVLANTLVSTLVFAGFWVIYTYHLVSLEDLATLWGLIGTRHSG
jgi:predicted secreted protein